MNNRIEELFKQAGGKTTTHSLASNPVQYREIRELWDDHIEKFAELIVRECASVVERDMDRAKPIWCSDKILNHFGINQEIVSGGGGGYEGPRIGGKGGKDDSTFVCPPEENGPNMFSKYDGDGW